MRVRLALDEETFCQLLGGEILCLSAAIGRTGFKRGEERLTLEICLAEELEPLRATLMTTLTAFNRENNRE
jgi:hypothetical protein